MATVATMCAIQLLFFLLTAFNPESTASINDSNAGMDFIFAFPENIAYYYPEDPINVIKVNAFYPSTYITVNNVPGLSQTLHTGQTHEFPIPGSMELNKSEYSNTVFQISATKRITVQVISQKHNSVQTAVITPVEKLATEYRVPPVPQIIGTTQPANAVSMAITERGPFKLIVINADQANSVTIVGKENKELDLEPHQLVQVWVKEEEEISAVQATKPVAAFFGHPCAIRYNCTCGMVFTPLMAANDKTHKFIIPPHLTEGAKSASVLLVSETGSNKLQSFRDNQVEVPGSAIFYRPGMLLNLIPEQDFGACYLVDKISDIDKDNIIIVKKDETDGLHKGDQRLEGLNWQDVPGTPYVSAMIPAPSNPAIIWHMTSKIAIYDVAQKDVTKFGNPAPIISRTPDFRGCVLHPEILLIGDVKTSWREAVSYCKNKSLELICLSTHLFQNSIYNKLKNMNNVKNNAPLEWWIGIRRSSLTDFWYWLNDHAVNETSWADGEPGTTEDRQCGMMSLETNNNNNNFVWRHEDCCKKAYPICYQLPVTLNM